MVKGERDSKGLLDVHSPCLLKPFLNRPGDAAPYSLQLEKGPIAFSRSMGPDVDSTIVPEHYRIPWPRRESSVEKWEEWRSLCCLLRVHGCHSRAQPLQFTPAMTVTEAVEPLIPQPPIDGGTATISRVDSFFIIINL